MRWVREAGLWLGVTLAAAAAALAPSECLAKRPQPAPQAPSPPPPSMPSVGLGERFVTEAGAFDAYMRQAGAISPAFTDAGGVSSALRTGVAYEPGQLRRGAVASAAIAALGDAAFVADVRRAGATAQSRYAIIARLFADPASVLAFKDAAGAEGLAKEALVSSGMRLFSDGDAVRLAAYGIQHQAWSLADVADRDGRASAVKGLSAAPRTPPADETAALEREIAGQTAAGDPPDPAAPPYSPMVVRALALAALAAVGQAGDDAAANLGWLTDDYYLDHCLSEAKLSLFECLAVAKPNYEDVFCLGQHGMKDTGTCIVRSAGGVTPLEIATRAIPIPPLRAHHAVRRRRA
jgi:hypothetical protein